MAPECIATSPFLTHVEIISSMIHPTNTTCHHWLMDSLPGNWHMPVPCLLLLPQPSIPTSGLVPGYEAPVYIGWAQTNRSALIRIPRHTTNRDKATRAELRFPDPSANPYLAFAAILGAALDGIDRGLTPPKPLNNINVYHLTEEQRRKMKIASLPGSLAEALDELSHDQVIRDVLGPVVYEAFHRAKAAEWDDYRINVSDWEVERYLEIA